MWHALWACLSQRPSLSKRVFGCPFTHIWRALEDCSGVKACVISAQRNLIPHMRNNANWHVTGRCRNDAHIQGERKNITPGNLLKGCYNWFKSVVNTLKCLHNAPDFTQKVQVCLLNAVFVHLFIWLIFIMGFRFYGEQMSVLDVPCATPVVVN